MIARLVTSRDNLLACSAAQPPTLASVQTYTKNIEATPVVNKIPGVPVPSLAAFSDSSASWSLGNHTNTNAAAITHATTLSTKRNAVSSCLRTANRISGEHATAPTPHAKFSRLTTPALFFPPTSAVVKFVDGEINP